LLNTRSPALSLPLRCLAATCAVAALVSTALDAKARELTVTPQQRSTAQQVAQAGVALSDLAANAPDVYAVKRGDTLWDISKLFLKTPWRWPELWGMNLDEVRNPHLIYPGQTLVLEKSGGRARLRMGQAGGVGGGEGSTVKLSPRVRSEAAVEPIATVSLNLIAPFFQDVGLFNVDELALAPRIVAGPDERVILGKGDNAYVMGTIASERQWSVFRSARQLVDPTTKEVLAYEARLLGAAEYTRAGETRPAADGKTEVVPATFRITSVRSEIAAGDRLLAGTTVAPDLNFVPHAPAKAMSGQIVSVYGDSLIAGQNQIVAINRGSNAGIERGHVLAVLRDGRFVTDTADGRPTQVKLPDERHGLMLVFRVYERVSYALLLSVQNPVRAGDKFEQP
jgi:LysM repeat protein